MGVKRRVAPALVGALVLVWIAAATAPADVPPISTSTYRLPNGWVLSPAGTQVDTPRAPNGITVSPDAKTVFAVNGGIFDEQLTAIDATTFARTLAPATDMYMGVAADGSNNVWASGGNRNRIWHFIYQGPAAAGTTHAGLVPGTPNAGIPVIGYPGNMVLGKDGRLFVAGNLSVPNSAITEFDSKGGSCANSTICSVVNVIDVSNPFNRSPKVHVVPVGRDAYGVALNESNHKLYVSNWADETNPARGGTGTVSVVDVARAGSEREAQVVKVGHHPTGVALSPGGTSLVVTNSADDSITILSLGPKGFVTGKRTLSAKATPNDRRGATPLAAAFSPSGNYLFIALAGVNAVEVRTPDGRAIPRQVTLSDGSTLSVPHTYIPTGWYPSALVTAPSPDSSGDTRLYASNLKGIGAGPGANAQAAPITGTRTEGTVSAITVPSGSVARKSRFDAWTATVVQNNRWRPLFDPREQSAAEDPCKPAVLPNGEQVVSDIVCKTSRGEIDPRQLHVLYIVKENKTFDQYFGDIKPTLPGADADPTWLLYGEPVTTNQHELARRFTLSDDFWADSEQSTTGHSWTSAGYATEFNELTWNTEYDQGLRGDRWSGQYAGQFTGPRDPEVAEQEGELLEPAERLVDKLADPQTNTKGLTQRIYSDDVNDDSPAKQDQVPLGLWGIGSSAVHHGRDLDFPDTDRAHMFLDGRTISNAWSLDEGGNPPPTFGKEIAFSPEDREKFALAAWREKYQQCRGAGGTDASCQQAMPNFIYMALPVNHTLGFNPLSPTPASMVADNDYALGLIIEGLSKTAFWKRTLVLVTEDDTQAAGDHIDSHRTYLIASGGLARRLGIEGEASHQLGSFPSILKTVEVLFGLPPLTIYDRAAVPLHDVIVDSFAQANAVRYQAVRPPTPFLRNPEGTDLATLSASMDWRVDRTNPYLLRDLLYAGLRGWPLPERDLELLDTLTP